mmetsp:Transcript_105942/g.330400  ORF Transcript_105942/g.330400 Transcript_105942/m.330400 type:complete len:511 (+) Transcript_105942:1865-3397(+)
MRLHKVHIEGRNLGPSERAGYELLVRVAVRRGEGGGLARVVAVGPAGNGLQRQLVVHDELVVDLVQEWVHEHTSATLASDVAICSMVEGETTPSSGHQASPTQPSQGTWGEDCVDAQRNCGLCLRPLGQTAIHGLLEGQERRGCLHVHQVVRAVHAERVGEAVGKDGRGAAGGGQRTGLGRLRDLAPLQLACRPPRVDTHMAPHERWLPEASAETRLVADLEHVALVRIHAPGLVDTQAEELVVEHLNALDEDRVHTSVGVPHVVAILRLGSVVLLIVPPHEWDWLGRVTSREEDRLHVEDLACPPAVPNGAPADGDLLSAMVHVVGEALYITARDGLHLLLRLDRLLHGPHGVGEPPVQRLRYRRGLKVCLLSSELSVAVHLHEEAAECVGDSARVEPVRQHVRSEHHPHARADIECVASRGVVERLQLQDSRGGADEEDAHEPMPLENVQPLDAILRGQLSRRQVSALPSLEQIAWGAGAQLKTEVRLGERLHDCRHVQDLPVESFDR